VHHPAGIVLLFYQDYKTLKINHIKQDKTGKGFSFSLFGKLLFAVIKSDRDARCHTLGLPNMPVPVKKAFGFDVFVPHDLIRVKQKVTLSLCQIKNRSIWFFL
jgi:hypothetical protein